MHGWIDSMCLEAVRWPGKKKKVFSVGKFEDWLWINDFSLEADI